MRTTLFVLGLLAWQLVAIPAHATVTVHKTSDTFDCSGGTTYTFTFPILSTSHIAVTKWQDATPTVITTLTSGTQYTVSKTASGGTVTLIGSGSCSSGWNLKVARVVPYTQLTSFRTQGTFVPKSHEDAFDNIEMQIQQALAGISQSEDTAAAIEDHIASSDDHAGYAKLAGRSGGQTLNGGVAANESLVLSSTAYTRKGSVWIGSLLQADEYASEIGIFVPVSFGSDVSIDGGLSVVGDAEFSGVLEGANSSGASLYLRSTAHATKGKIMLGTASAYDEVNLRLGIGTATPTVALDVVGSANVSTKVTTPSIVGQHSSGGSLSITSSDTGLKGTISIGTITDLEASYKVGVRTATPHTTLQVAGTFSALREVQTKTSNYTVVAPEDCNTVIFVPTDEVKISLPDNNTTQSTRTDGCMITIVSSGTAGAQDMYVDTYVDDTIFGTCGYVDTADGYHITGVRLGTAGPKKLKSSSSSTPANAVGDYITVVGDGVSGWWTLGCVGTWGEVSK